MKSSVSQSLVEPYAEAIMEIAQSQNLVDEFGDNIAGIRAALSESDDLRNFLAVPLAKDEAKKEVIQQVFGDQVHPIMLNFMLLMVDKRRIMFLDEVGVAFQGLLRQLRQISLAEITSAIELSEEQAESIRNKVKAMTGAQSVELEVSVKPELIGGVIIKVGSQIVDASIRGQLRRLSNRLVGSVS
ncbi:ATP synthase subunit delta [Thalassoporum mexicanum PCC 7367]|uniref:ATP synthase F1 subunit delta n=1 Tax=Thalassoporum mexicanum TaxID=3457544 RepID=UPI00029FE0CC|nr:ATP synthase F1 subunit delta [Pseudanabaena sp. PCC 7367]AFY70565.1 ATP synthase subunit delta [Pseudanabaena sp. PCC 7367]